FHSKATSVDITPQRKGGFLRPVTVRGDSFRSELDGSGKAGKPPRPISTGSLRPISTGTSTVHWPSSPAARSSYQPEWAQDTENVLLPAATVDDHGSPEDLKDMLRMGRTQEMRSVQTILLISFGCLSQCTWEFVLLVPSSGGQYVWVSEFAGKRCQSFLSYIAGYMTLIGWQCGNASGIFLTGSLIQCIITIYRPENGAIMWQTVVFLLPCVAFVILVNIYGGRAMAISQNISMSVHILALIAVVVIMWVLSPHLPTDRALFRIENTEWSSTALAMLAGQANMNYSCSYSDSPVHLSEEVQDAAIVVPKVIMRSLWISGICGLLVVVTFVFCIPSVADALSHPTGYSFLYVMQLSVPNGVIVCVLLVLLGLVGSSSIGFAAATARITYAFARDQGLPFSQWIGKVNKNRNIPINAVLLTAAVSVLLSLINLGSSSAFYGIVTLGQAAQSLSYILAIASVLYRRIKSPETLPKARWSLGGYWRPVIINTLAITFSMNSFIWSFSPPTLPVTSTNFNPSGALFVGALVLMMATYFLRAKRLYATGGAYQRHPNWNLSHLSTGQNVQFLTIPEEF
ncbi:unnamed protein product, partial [Aureobasidium pullulans]